MKSGNAEKSNIDNTSTEINQKKAWSKPTVKSQEIKKITKGFGKKFTDFHFPILAAS